MKAAEKLFQNHPCDKNSIDFILFCSQTPDYFLPSTSCLIQDRLGLPDSAGSFDYTLGCSGYVQGLSLAKGLIESGQARNLLLITADTLTKLLDSNDRSVRLLFGDAAAATFIQGVENDEEKDFIGPFVFGTDGSGAENLIVKNGGSRNPFPFNTNADADLSEDDFLKMNGKEVFNFTIKEVPKAYKALLDKSGCSIDDIDNNVFHQANTLILEHVRKKIGIPTEKYIRCLRDVGNTSSCSIPIALKYAQDNGKISKGDLIALVSFGVGYSWNATLMRWQG